MPGVVRAGGQVGLGRRRPKRYMRVWARARLRGAHRKHVAHDYDAGGVEAQRLIERLRVLPSHKGGIRCRARCGLAGRWAWGGGGASGTCTGRPQLKAWGPCAHDCGERTPNILYMVVTLDVSKLSG